MKAEMRECPFCQSYSLFIYRTMGKDYDFCAVQCKCGACGPIGRNSDAAVFKWNVRDGKCMVERKEIELHVQIDIPAYRGPIAQWE